VSSHRHAVRYDFAIFRLELDAYLEKCAFVTMWKRVTECCHSLFFVLISQIFNWCNNTEL